MVYCLPCRAPLLIGALLLLGGLAGCGGPRSGGDRGPGAAQTGSGQPADDRQVGEQSLLLVSYSVTKGAYDRILPTFQADWKRRTGQTIRVTTSYGASGSQARAVIDGLAADLVSLALPADVLKLQKAGLVQPGWEKELPDDANITHSVVALLTRAGNPRGIKDWSDLARPGVAVITPNPKTSGGARWNLLALWGAGRRAGGGEQGAETFVMSVFRNVSNLPKDAREASDAFLNRGQGDVLLTYENEALLAARKAEGRPTSLVVPPLNLRIDGPVAVVDRNVDRRGTRKAAEALAAYLQGEQAQRIFAEEGFRPVNATVWKERQDRYAPVTTMMTSADFGGWPVIDRTFFARGGIWDRLAAARR